MWRGKGTRVEGERRWVTVRLRSDRAGSSSSERRSREKKVVITRKRCAGSANISTLWREKLTIVIRSTCFFTTPLPLTEIGGAGRAFLISRHQTEYLSGNRTLQVTLVYYSINVKCITYSADPVEHFEIPPSRPLSIEAPISLEYKTHESIYNASSQSSSSKIPPYGWSA